MTEKITVRSLSKTNNREKPHSNVRLFFIKMSRPEITKHKTDRYRKEYELYQTQ
jgi:hypothetical protein